MPHHMMIASVLFRHLLVDALVDTAITMESVTIQPRKQEQFVNVVKICLDSDVKAQVAHLAVTMLLHGSSRIQPVLH
jgi:hypothetical protein